jgi:uncharacterized membrane protein YtjA (UPF0391 family)
MLYWAALFLVIALIAGGLGLFAVSGAAADMAKILFFAFIAVAVFSFLAGVRRKLD